MSDSWKPVSYVQLISLLTHSESQLEEITLLTWHAIRLPAAELWQQHPWGNEGCGFWVVAVAGRHCLYYNDITEGFAIGHFDRWGHISNYQKSDSSLNTALNKLLQPAAIEATA
ncbi:hypothetical protein [Thalassolituus maritimus]|uniref:Uncharacterized protein n=1 Tax=Thalassolituus maritimus TaxID=484498 RepID=A0ABQ0A1X4_9GAMM